MDEANSEFAQRHAPPTGTTVGKKRSDGTLRGADG
jgi:hypothetical protein